MIFGRSSDQRRKKEQPCVGSRSLCWVLPALLMLATTQHLQAQKILHYLPEDALGFVLVRDVAGANKKCEHLIQMFEASLPAPLAFAQFSTGLREGVDFDGDVLISLIPGSHASAPPEPLVLLPIADYGKFAASIHGDDSGEVCRVTIAGEDVLVARHGPYAMIMNVENRETLEILIGLEPEPVALLKPWAAWLEDNVATIGVMPAGVKKLLELGRQGLAQQRLTLDDEFGNPEFSDALVQMHQGLVVYQTMLDLFGAEVDRLAFGFSIDETSNLRAGLRLLWENDHRASAATTTTATTPAAPLAGYPDQPFVLAGGGPLDGTWMNSLIKAGVQVMRQMPETYGYEEFQEEQWQDLETSYQDFVKSVRCASVLMLPGEKGEPLFSNFFGTAQVHSAAQYLQSYRKSVETWNRLMAQSTSDIRLQYEIREIKVGGAEACELLVDVATAARDPNVPMFNWMLEAMFGKEGKLRTLIVAADEKTLVYGMAGEQRMTRVIEQVKQQEMGLQKSVHVQTTHKLLTPAAAWKFYVSPQGCVTWTKRIMDELFGQILPQTMVIPEYESSPPVGISVHLHEGQAEVDVVWPIEALQALADYIKKCKEL